MYTFLAKAISCSIGFSMLLSIHVEARSPHQVICGGGKRIEVSDSKYMPGNEAGMCLRAGYRPPDKKKMSTSLKAKDTKRGGGFSDEMPDDLPAGGKAVRPKTATAQLGTQAAPHQTAGNGCKYDPNSARLPDCKNQKLKPKPKPGCEYDPNSARLPCSDQSSRSANQLRGANTRAAGATLLLPAVQAAPE